jgi:hypothetical protein
LRADLSARAEMMAVQWPAALKHLIPLTTPILMSSKSLESRRWLISYTRNSAQATKLRVSKREDRSESTK